MLPRYICGSIIKSAFDAKLEVQTYYLDESLYPKSLPSPFPKNCAFIYVNYFGLCQKNVIRLKEEIPSSNLIIDNSQALFAKHLDVLASVYSPRKFVGLPDGGLLRASSYLNVVLPEKEDTGSIARMRHLLLRLAYSAREGYSDFQSARNSLQDTTPLMMSRLTQRLMRSIRWDEVIQRRKENFSIVAKKMDHINEMKWDYEKDDVPLCYPLMLPRGKVKQIKKELVSQNIFTPTYWPDSLPSMPGTIEEFLFMDTMYLPIDQRLDRGQIDFVCNTVEDLLLKNKS